MVPTSQLNSQQLKQPEQLRMRSPLPSPRSSFFPSRHPVNTPLASLPASKTEEALYVHQPGETEGFLFLGFDCSTQGLKVVAVNEVLQVVAEQSVNFSDELPQFGTVSGVHLGPDDGVVTAPVAMYLAAMDLLFKKLDENDFPFERVVSISGAGQQHACVLFNQEASGILAELNPEQTLAEQLLSAFSSPTVTNWQDSSTTRECAEIEGGLAGGRDELSQVSGSKAHTRFTGPQIRKLIQRGAEGVYEKTASITLVSSWFASILTQKIQPLDESDACGMNLYDIEGRKWNEDLVRLTAGRSSDPEVLLAKLGKVETDPGKTIGSIGAWWQKRWGFGADCGVAPFTGDNPSTLLSFNLSPGDAVISLGTSDTVLLASDQYRPCSDYHVFAHPAGDASDGHRRYMSMLCYKNGSLSRERIRDEVANGSWNDFNALTEGTPAPDSVSRGIIVFNFDKPEIIPTGAHGIHVFRDGQRLPGGVKDLDEVDKLKLPRRCLESQFLSFRKRVAEILDGAKLQRVFVAGGGSINPTITSMISNILGCPAYVSQGSSQGCAIGAAYRAAWAYKKREDPKVAFEKVVQAAQGDPGLHGHGPVDTSPVAGMRKVADPNDEIWAAYGEILPGWERLEAEVIRFCSLETAAN